MLFKIDPIYGIVRTEEPKNPAGRPAGPLFGMMTASEVQTDHPHSP